MDYKEVLILVVAIMFFNSVSGNQLHVNMGPYHCWECNVWKAGYGHVCDKPRNRTGCWACMKIESVVFMGFYKNTPRYTSIISRVCAKTKLTDFVAGCRSYKTVDGHNKRCFCFGHNCNQAATTTATTTATFLTLLSATFLLKPGALFN